MSPGARMPASIPLLDAAGARAGDAAAVAAGDDREILMERAAGHLARTVVELAGGGYGRRVTLVVGKGDNGGDGWAAARRLEREHGARAWVVAPDGVDVEASAATGVNRARWRAMGGRTSAGTDELEAALAGADVAVDCLLGTGVHGAPRGPAGIAARALLEARARGVAVVACDVPSGVSADDGSAPEGAVRADVTVTLGGLKRGLVLHPGAAHAGRVVVGGLGGRYVPDTGEWAALTPAGAAPRPYAADVDKRARGVVLVAAGALGTAGAAALASSGALAAGAGLVTAVTPDAVRGEVASRTDPGVMVRGLPSDAEGGFAAPDAPADASGLPGDERWQRGAPTTSTASTAASPDPARYDCVAAGPGIGVGAGAAAMVADLRARARRLVLDADALNVHRDDPSTLADHAGQLVLTPHERELARIGGGGSGPDAFAARAERVPRLARELDATIVAKGPGTLVAAPDGRVWVTPVGDPALGSGGTGDVLTGVLAAAVAVADDVPLAVARAVWWHAAAGRLAGRTCAGRARASDLLAALGPTLAVLARWAGAAHPRAAVAEAGRLVPPWDAWEVAP